MDKTPKQRDYPYGIPPLPEISIPKEHVKTRTPSPINPHHFTHKTYETFILYSFTFLLLLPLTLQIIVQNWEMVPITVLLMSLNLLAARYAKHPNITHHFAKLIRKIYFVTFGHPEDHLPSKQIVRLPILFALPILLLILGIPIAIGHQRPPLIDTHRYLEKQDIWII